MVEQAHEIQPDANAYLDIFYIGSKGNFFLIDDVPAARTQLQFIAILT